MRAKSVKNIISWDGLWVAQNEWFLFYNIINFHFYHCGLSLSDQLERWTELHYPPPRVESCPFWTNEDRYLCIFCCQTTNYGFSFFFPPWCSQNPSWFREPFSHELPQPWENSLITWVWMCLVRAFFLFTFFALRSVSDLRPRAAQPSGPLVCQRSQAQPSLTPFSPNMTNVLNKKNCIFALLVRYHGNQLVLCH